jgi:hypothetical protein
VTKTNNLQASRRQSKPPVGFIQGLPVLDALYFLQATYSSKGLVQKLDKNIMKK